MKSERIRKKERSVKVPTFGVGDCVCHREAGYRDVIAVHADGTLDLLDDFGGLMRHVPADHVELYCPAAKRGHPTVSKLRAAAAWRREYHTRGGWELSPDDPLWTQPMTEANYPLDLREGDDEDD